MTPGNSSSIEIAVRPNHIRPTNVQWKPGDLINGRLQIKELIGKGGMGVVWKVHHREWNKDLAVKMPLPALIDSPTAKDRFLREAETWINLGVHPHIVQCWFVLEVSGLPCLFLDYLTGGSLKNWIDNKHVQPGQWKQILEIAIQTSEGLAYAHSRGVIHRDVKPANLLIRGDDRVCVTDFGIVKTATSNDNGPSNHTASERSLPENSGLTGIGAYLGTPQYGAPEQWGAAEDVDERADVYALGVTLYELCCGRRPFDSDLEVLPPEVLIEKHLTGEVPDPQTFFPDIPPALSQLVLKCLEKHRNHRPSSMTQLQHDLEDIYLHLVGTPYQGVGSVPNELSPDTINNRAVSLYSLGKKDEARDAWRQGLRVESGHPECLYNLTQVDKHNGLIGPEESLRRLQQIQAKLPLALLYIEEHQPENAIKLLSELPKRALDNGPTQRALGDALMYTKQYYAAEKAYRQALAAMPADADSQERKRLASLGKRGILGRILFPSPSPTFHVITTEDDTYPLITPDSATIIGLNQSSITLWSVEEECVQARAARQLQSTSIRKAWCTQTLLLLEDDNAFELWRLPELSFLGRKNGSILAQTACLHRLLVQDRTGFNLFNVDKAKLEHLSIPPSESGANHVNACFDHDEDQLCLLLPTGEIATLNDQGIAVAESWPPPLPLAADISSITLNALGTTIYVGYSSGRLLALNIIKKTERFDLKLPLPISKIESSPATDVLLVSLSQGFIVIDHRGCTLLQGDGPAIMDKKRHRILSFHQKKLTLHNISPFQKLRTWTELTTVPHRLALATNGCRAISSDTTGAFDLWEVDEDSRVFERQLMLSPGRDFAEIVSASKRFQAGIAQVQDDLSHDRVATAYRNLNRARQVPGYAQAPQALTMNWYLLDILRRNKLEAVWERLDVVGKEIKFRVIALSNDGRYLLVSEKNILKAYIDTGDATKNIWSLELKDSVIAINILESNPGEGVVVALDSQGEGGIYKVTDGALCRPISMNYGRLKQISLRQNLAFFLAESGALGTFDIIEQTIISEVSGRFEAFGRFYPLNSNSVILGTPEGIALIELDKKKGRALPLSSDKLTGSAKLSFAHCEGENSLLLLGFKDGSLLIYDTARERPVFSMFQIAHGAVSGFEIVLPLSLGIVTTDNGQLIFIDLQEEKILHAFCAHRTKILQLCCSTSGRYLATAAQSGHVRLWETSWTAYEDQPEPPLPWLTEPKKLTRPSQFLRLQIKPK